MKSIIFGLLSLMIIASSVSQSDAAVAVVKRVKSVPTLFINGKPTAPVLFQIGFMGETKVGQSEISFAAEHGVNIVSPTLWGMPWFKDDETPSFDKTDIVYWIDAVLKANPNALLLPRFPVDQPPGWWVEQHPDEMTLFHDGTKGIASIHSQVWRQDAAKQIGRLVRLLEARYGDHMIGYHVCGQYSAEWFYDGFWEGKYAGFEKPAIEGFRRYLRTKYKSDKALRKAWNDPGVSIDTAQVPTVNERNTAKAGSFRNPSTDCKAIDFDEFQNNDMADSVALMCKAVKDAAPNRLALAFYGYIFELSGSTRSGHLGLSRLLKSPYIDGICGPYSYGARKPGDSGRFMGPVDSILANGKLWFTEDDTRTFLTPPDAGPGRCVDIKETNNVLTRNFAQVLTRGAGLWWMEPVGSGWYADKALWQHQGLLKQTYQSSLPLTEYTPEVAVIIDERSCLYTSPFMEGVSGEGASISLLTRFREQYYRLGAPIGMYLLGDLLAGKVPPAKMYILVNLFNLDNSQLRAIRSRVCNSGRTVVWMYAPGIIKGNTFSPENVSKVVGMKLKQINSGDGNIVIERTGAKFSAEHSHLSPTYAVDDSKSTTIARYLSGDVSAAAKTMDGHTSVYCGTLQLPSSVLRSLAIKAGVHIYSNQDQIIMAGNGFLAIHATSNGQKRIVLPLGDTLYDALTNTSLGKNSIFTFDMQMGETKLLRTHSLNE